MSAILTGDTSRGSGPRLNRRKWKKVNAVDPARFARKKDLLEGVKLSTCP